MSSTESVQRSLKGGSDTIVALSTPAGRGALAIVRLSGEDAIEIASRHISPWPLNVREPRLCVISEAKGDGRLDQAMVTVYQSPRSFTGEDVVEICTHGGHVVPASVMAALIGSGARQSLPGEFTRRALLNGKLDIVQAEAIGDLVDAQSSAMQQAALSQLDGGLSSRINSVREGIIGLEALIAYDIDFPEEDDGPISQDRITDSTDSLIQSLDLLLYTVPVGQIVKDGAVVVISGEPNAGKSALFNGLLGEYRAIVTEIPGTTRDAIEGLITAGRWPIRLIDTAGLHESKEVVERLGIEISERYISHAHLVLVCGDSETSLRAAASIVSEISSAPSILVLTKGDLMENTASQQSYLERPDEIVVSALTGAGLESLRVRMEQALAESYGEISPEVPLLIRVRHIQALSGARAEISEFRSAWLDKTLPAPVASVHLRTAAVVLEELIGAVSVDDVLERVFSSFCVGK